MLPFNFNFYESPCLFFISLIIIKLKANKISTNKTFSCKIFYILNITLYKQDQFPFALGT